MRYLSFAQLKTEKGIPWTRVHVDRLEKAGKFPKRVQLGPNTVRWLETEIDAWFESKATERFETSAAA